MFNLRQGAPLYGGYFFVVADLCRASRDTAGEVDQVSSGIGVNAIAETLRNFYGQSDLILYLPDRGLFRRLARFDVASRRRPHKVALWESAVSHENAILA